jgi:hypothetical protein
MMPTIKNGYAIFPCKPENLEFLHLLPAPNTVYRLKVICVEEDGEMRWETRIPILSNRCNCKVQILMSNGCQCGGY